MAPNYVTIATIHHILRKDCEVISQVNYHIFEMHSGINVRLVSKYQRTFQGTQSHVSRCSSPSLRGSHIMVEIMKSERSVGGPDRGGGGGAGGFESSNASHPLR